MGRFNFDRVQSFDASRERRDFAAAASVGRLHDYVVGAWRRQRVTRRLWGWCRSGRGRCWIDFVVMVLAVDPGYRHRRWAAHSSRCAQRPPHAIRQTHATDGSKDPGRTQRALTPVKSGRPKKSKQNGFAAKSGRRGRFFGSVRV